MDIKDTKYGKVEIEIEGSPDDCYLTEGYSVTLERDLTDAELEEIYNEYAEEIYWHLREWEIANAYDRWKDSRYGD